MKKILIIGFLAAYSHLTNAQNAGELGAVNIDTTMGHSRLLVLEEKLNKHEDRLEALKKENEALKEQMKQLKPLFNSERKVIISRKGSKQLIVN